jgi:hypothetical protein
MLTAPTLRDGDELGKGAKAGLVAMATGVLRGRLEGVVATT